MERKTIPPASADGEPPQVLLVRPPLWNSICAPTPPLGLGYLLGNLKRAGISAAMLDLERAPDGVARLRGMLTGAQPPTLIGVQVYSNELPAAQRTIAFIRELQPQATIVAGGPHVSTMPDELFRHLPQLDYGIQGDGESSLVSLARNLPPGEEVATNVIPGLIRRRNGGTVAQPPEFPENLDPYGMPDWDGMNLALYDADAFGGGFNRSSPAMCLQTSRGCPNRCSFCAVAPIAGGRCRTHSGALVVEQIKQLLARGYREIKIVDDNFGIDIRHVREIRQAFEREGLRLPVSFACGFHCRSINEETIDHLKMIGIYEIMLAIESGVDRVLGDMQKGISTALVRQKVEMLRHHGLPVTGFFIIGYPTETARDIETTIRFALALPLERAHFNCFSPFPGTEIHRRLREEGRLDDLRMEAVHIETPSYSFVPGLSVHDLQRLRRRALLRFYFRPRTLWSFVRGMSNPSVARFRLQKALEYFGWSQKKKTVDQFRQDGD